MAALKRAPTRLTAIFPRSRARPTPILTRLAVDACLLGPPLTHMLQCWCHSRRPRSCLHEFRIKYATATGEETTLGVTAPPAEVGMLATLPWLGGISNARHVRGGGAAAEGTDGRGWSPDAQRYGHLNTSVGYHHTTHGHRLLIHRGRPADWLVAHICALIRTQGGDNHIITKHKKRGPGWHYYPRKWRRPCCVV